MQVADTMATHTTGAAHDLSGDELALVLDAACAVVFHLDVASGDVRWSGPVAALTGAGEPPATFEAFLECVHSDDRAALHAFHPGAGRTDASAPVRFPRQELEQCPGQEGESDLRQDRGGRDAAHPQGRHEVKDESGERHRAERHADHDREHIHFS